MASAPGAVRVCLGGTFDPFRAGHCSLPTTAMEGADELFVGVRGAPLAKRPCSEVAGWAARARRIEDILRLGGCTGREIPEPCLDGVS